MVIGSIAWARPGGQALCGGAAAAEDEDGGPCGVPRRQRRADNHRADDAEDGHEEGEGGRGHGQLDRHGDADRRRPVGLDQDAPLVGENGLLGTRPRLRDADQPSPD
jgi:hypothetical protein